ncbi:universal stress protein [Phenylobacterium sp.]|uniref:universal stress protein n=1 Tax=Phenylobacterium sp. TaxID=1871053 RepID=UPI002731A34B|nr:universal stress protein [Phenylobacterium sp.]MDP1601437.1 universal stress protein [Phenylobacterium sp.]MDP3592823.1 universal stress protein [Phenylobacterium sp.]
MYKHILISTDGSEVAQKGLDHGLSLAKEIGAKVSIITVTESFPVYASAGAGVGAGWVPIEMADYDKVQDEFANRVFAGAKQAAEQHGVAVETIHVRNAQPAEAILETAKAQGCDLIVMASHGRRGLGRLLLGSQTSEVVTRSPLPVLVVR